MREMTTLRCFYAVQQMHICMQPHQTLPMNGLGIQKPDTTMMLFVADSLTVALSSCVRQLGTGNIAAGIPRRVCAALL